MKEELVNVLNFKLESVTNNIMALNNINDMLDFENNNLKYVEGILDVFRTGEDQYEIKNFGEIKREDFDKIMTLVPETTASKFETNSCNYDGLIYLIDGINNGISLTLTTEQEDAIKLMLNGITDKRLEYRARIEGINLAKGDLEETDLSILENKKDTYENILDEFDNDNYVSEVEDVIEAIHYSNVEDHDTVGMLGYLLKYNAEIYDDLKENGGFREKDPFHKPDVATIDLPEEEPEVEEEVNEKEESVEETSEEEEQEGLNYDFEKENDLPLDTPLDLPVDETTDFSGLVEEKVKEDPVEETEQEEVVEPVLEETTPLEKEEETPEEEKQAEETYAFEPEMELKPGFVKEETNDNEVETSNVDIPEQIINNLINETEVTDTTSTIDEVELKRMLEDYHVKYDDLGNKEELLKGDIENYKDILNIFKDNDLLSDVTKNEGFLKAILVNSNKDIVNEILDIVRRDFSIDEEDFYETARITIDSMPSIFVKEPTGNYNNFMKNIDFLKELNFDLITLFDFSRELLLVDNDLIEKNYKLVKRYDVKVETKNAKYLLALDNSVESIDYYVEAVYEDKITKKTFDGMNIVKTYPSKLDSVKDLTIKRLRYSSENGKKMFGSRENSIAGEIANLKVDVLNIPDEYLSKFFNNEFNDITNEEVDSYLEMIRNNTNYDFNEDNVLAELNKYRDGYRYKIADVNISYNKVLRNYNILINNNVDKEKALEFAVCYNLVCTKEEYANILNELKAIGGK